MGHDERIKCTADRNGEMDRWQEKCEATEEKEEAVKELSECGKQSR